MLRWALGPIGVLAVLWLAGLAVFVVAIGRAPPPEARRTDAIVVLTGGTQRLETGLALLSAGRAKKLFVSGVGQGVALQALLRARPASPALVACCVVLGRAADNTLGNAIETADWMKREGFRSLRLVTANYHMPRALLEFRRVLPKADVIVPDPVFPEGARLDQPRRWMTAAPVIVTEYLKFLGAVIRPLLDQTRPARR